MPKLVTAVTAAPYLNADWFCAVCSWQRQTKVDGEREGGWLLELTVSGAHDQQSSSPCKILLLHRFLGPFLSTPAGVFAIRWKRITHREDCYFLHSFKKGPLCNLVEWNKGAVTEVRKGKRKIYLLWPSEGWTLSLITFFFLKKGFHLCLVAFTDLNKKGTDFWFNKNLTIINPTNTKHLFGKNVVPLNSKTFQHYLVASLMEDFIHQECLKLFSSLIEEQLPRQRLNLSSLPSYNKTTVTDYFF